MQSQAHSSYGVCSFANGVEVASTTAVQGNVALEVSPKRCTHSRSTQRSVTLRNSRLRAPPNEYSAALLYAALCRSHRSASTAQRCTALSSTPLRRSAASSCMRSYSTSGAWCALLRRPGAALLHRPGAGPPAPGRIGTQSAADSNENGGGGGQVRAVSSTVGLDVRASGAAPPHRSIPASPRTALWLSQ